MENFIPNRYKQAIAAIKSLKDEDKYLGAYIFGSVARGDDNVDSDLDIQVITSETFSCGIPNRKKVGDIVVDISFSSIDKVRPFEDKNKKRKPRLQEGIVLFDKTGEIRRLQKLVRFTKREMPNEDQISMIRFLAQNTKKKVIHTRESDPTTCLLIMHTSLIDVINWFYDLNEAWHVSDKRMIQDLLMWCPEVGMLVKNLVRMSEVSDKADLFCQLTDKVISLSARKAICTGLCGCSICEEGIKKIESYSLDIEL